MGGRQSLCGQLSGTPRSFQSSFWCRHSPQEATAERDSAALFFDGIGSAGVLAPPYCAVRGISYSAWLLDAAFPLTLALSLRERELRRRIDRSATLSLSECGQRFSLRLRFVIGVKNVQTPEAERQLRPTDGAPTMRSIRCGKKRCRNGLAGIFFGGRPSRAHRVLGPICLVELLETRFRMARRQNAHANM